MKKEKKLSELENEISFLLITIQNQSIERREM